MGGRGSLRGDRAWGKGGEVAGGLEQGSWGLGRVSKGLGGWGLERAEGLGSGGGLDPYGTSGRTFVRLFVRLLGRTDGKFTPLSYRTSSPSGPLPKKEDGEKEKSKFCFLPFKSYRQGEKPEWSTMRPQATIHFFSFFFSPFFSLFGQRTRRG